MANNISYEKTVLINDKPFYGCLLGECKVTYSETLVPTLGVYVSDRLNLAINPTYWASVKTLKERVALLEHELLHLLNEHPMRGKAKEHMIFNIASDMAINQYIQNLPPGGVTLPKGWEANRETEYYYDKLMENAKIVKLQMPNDGKNGGRGDHEIWGQSTASQSLQKQIVRDGVVKAAERSGQNFGNLPSQIKESIQTTLNEHTINWQSILRNLITKFQKGKWYSTWKRPNRRWDATKGQLRENELKLVIGVDTSGSIDSELLEVFLNEIDFIKNYCRDVIIMECDTQIHKEYKLKHKARREVEGRGGTDFRPVFERAKKLGPSLIVYFTDGCGDYPETSTIPTLWVLYNTDQKAPFGKSMFQMRGGKRI